MKRVTVYILSLIAGISMLSSCSSDLADENVFESKHYLSISTDIADTRAIIDRTYFIDGDVLGYYCKSGNAEYQGKATRIKGQWVMDKQIPVEKEWQMYAYYPYSDDIKIADDGTTITGLNISFKGSEGQSDYMAAKVSGDAQRTVAQLNFRHALSRITFSLRRDSESKGAGRIVRATLGDKNAEATPTLFTNASLTNLNNFDFVAGSEKSLVQEMDTILSIGRTYNIEFLTFPMDVAENQLCMTFNIDGTDVVIDIPSAKWESGQQYTYPVLVKDAIPLNKFVNGYEFLFMGFRGDNGKPLYWATCNIGATAAEQNGNYYAWGEITTKEDYSWRTYLCTEMECGTNKDPLKGIRNIAGMKDFDAAAAIWGGTSRIPSEAEFNKLIEECDWEQATVNNVEVYRVKSKINNNVILLPAAGLRNSKALLYDGEYGYYWTSNANMYYAGYACKLQFDKETTTSHSCGIEGRFVGMPIRPVTE